MPAFSELLKTSADLTSHTTISTSKRSRTLGARKSVQVVNQAANSVTFTFEGSNDGINWQTLFYSLGGGGTYINTGATLTGGSKGIYFFPDADFVRYLRVNITAANTNGTTFQVVGTDA